jgi:hypothetical protein
VPAAAVIPALIAYIKVVAVKMFVVQIGFMKNILTLYKVCNNIISIYLKFLLDFYLISF